MDWSVGQVEEEFVGAPNHSPQRRAGPARPQCQATEPRDNLAPFHSITSSARASSEGGIVRPAPEPPGS
jgi:hypothetical protein